MSRIDEDIELLKSMRDSLTAWANNLKYYTNEMSEAYDDLGPIEVESQIHEINSKLQYVLTYLQHEKSVDYEFREERG